MTTAPNGKRDLDGLRAVVEPLERIIRKCEQYWNESNVCEAEWHCALERIHEDARHARAALAAQRDTKENK